MVEQDTADGPGNDFDAQALERLRSSLAKAPGGLGAFLELYLQEGERHMARMEVAAQDGDLDILERAAHALKPTSALVGAVALSDACRQIEAGCRSGAWRDGDAVEHVEGVRRLWADVRERLPLHKAE